jgi:hypothetical protein
MTTADPTAGHDGVIGPATPTPPPDSKPALNAATSFAQRWLRRDRSANDWHARLSPLVTEALAAELKGVDPRNVPASKMVDDPQAVVTTETYVRVVVPMDTGSLVLKVFRTPAGWRVGEVDWEQA